MKNKKPSARSNPFGAGSGPSVGAVQGAFAAAPPKANSKSDPERRLPARALQPATSAPADFVEEPSDNEVREAMAAGAFVQNDDGTGTIIRNGQIYTVPADTVAGVYGLTVPEVRQNIRRARQESQRPQRTAAEDDAVMRDAGRNVTVDVGRAQIEQPMPAEQPGDLQDPQTRAALEAVQAQHPQVSVDIGQAVIEKPPAVKPLPGSHLGSKQGPVQSYVPQSPVDQQFADSLQFTGPTQQPAAPPPAPTPAPSPVPTQAPIPMGMGDVHLQEEIDRDRAAAEQQQHNEQLMGMYQNSPFLPMMNQAVTGQPMSQPPAPPPALTPGPAPTPAQPGSPGPASHPRWRRVPNQPAQPGSPGMPGTVSADALAANQQQSQQAAVNSGAVVPPNPASGRQTVAGGLVDSVDLATGVVSPRTLGVAEVRGAARGPSATATVTQRALPPRRILQDAEQARQDLMAVTMMDGMLTRQEQQAIAGIMDQAIPMAEGLLGQYEDVVANHVQQTNHEIAGLQRAISELGSRTVDPNRLFASSGGFGAVSAAINIGLGTMMQVMAPGVENTALRVIEGALERDMQAQLADLDNGQRTIANRFNMLEHQERLWGTREQAILALRAMHYEDAARRVEAAATRFGGEAAARQAAILAETLRLEGANQMVQLYSDRLTTQLQISGPAGPVLQASEALRAGAEGGVGVAQEQGVAQPAQQGQQPVRDWLQENAPNGPNEVPQSSTQTGTAAERPGRLPRAATRSGARAPAGQPPQRPAAPAGGRSAQAPSRVSFETSYLRPGEAPGRRIDRHDVERIAAENGIPLFDASGRPQFHVDGHRDDGTVTFTPLRLHPGYEEPNADQLQALRESDTTPTDAISYPGGGRLEVANQARLDRASPDRIGDIEDDVANVMSAYADISAALQILNRDWSDRVTGGEERGTIEALRMLIGSRAYVILGQGQMSADQQQQFNSMISAQSWTDFTPSLLRQIQRSLLSSAQGRAANIGYRVVPPPEAGVLQLATEALRNGGPGGAEPSREPRGGATPAQTLFTHERPENPSPSNPGAIFDIQQDRRP